MWSSSGAYGPPSAMGRCLLPERHEDEPVGCLRAIALVFLASLFATPAGAKEDNPRLEKERARLRRALARLDDPDPTLRLEGLETTSEVLGWQGAGMFMILEPLESALLAKRVAIFCHERLHPQAPTKEKELCAHVLHLLAGHTPETRQVLGHMVGGLKFLFGLFEGRALHSWIEALALVGERADALTWEMRPLLLGEDKRLSRRVAFALGRIDGPKAREALVEARAHETEHVRRASWYGWRFVGEMNVAEVQAILAKLRDAKDGGYVRAAALHFHGSIAGSSEGVQRLITQLVEGPLVSEETSERRLALNLLRRIGPAAIAQQETIWSRLDEDPDARTRKRAGQALVDIVPSLQTARAFLDRIPKAKDLETQLLLVDLVLALAPYALDLRPRIRTLRDVSTEPRLREKLHSAVEQLELAAAR